jgi:cobalt-zinc-cadmium efflux system protein
VGLAHSTHAQHDHSQATGDVDERALRRATLLTLAFMAVEFAAGFYANSLALLADAGHMLTDAAALSLAWAAVRIAARPPDARRSFGYQRLQVLAGFVNGVALVGIVTWIAVAAVRRLSAPVQVDAPVVIAIGTFGAVINLTVYAMLRAARPENLNVAGATLHVLGDLAGSVAAMIAAVVILLTGWMPIDALLSILVCALVLRSAVVLVRRSTHILLEGAPEWLDAGELERTLEERVPEILDVHHVHCWSLNPQETLLTLHVQVADGADPGAVLELATRAIEERYGNMHVTVQIETGPCPDRDYRRDVAAIS